MTTMLERAARAMVLAEQDQWDLPADEWDRETLQTHGLMNLARAVLMAIKEPDETLSRSTQSTEGWEAMIDAILNERDEGQET